MLLMCLAPSGQWVKTKRSGSNSPKGTFQGLRRPVTEEKLTRTRVVLYFAKPRDLKEALAEMELVQSTQDSFPWIQDDIVDASVYLPTASLPILAVTARGQGSAASCRITAGILHILPDVQEIVKVGTCFTNEREPFQKWQELSGKNSRNII